MSEELKSDPEIEARIQRLERALAGLLRVVELHGIAHPTDGPFAREIHEAYQNARSALKQSL